MKLQERIDEVLKHYSEVIVGINRNETDNIISVNYPTTKDRLYRDLMLKFGAERVSKTSKGIKVIEKVPV